MLSLDLECGNYPIRWYYRLSKDAFLKKSRKYLFKRVPFKKSTLKCNDSTYYLEFDIRFMGKCGPFGEFVAEQNANAVSVNFPRFIIEFENAESALFTRLVHKDFIKDWQNVKELY